MPVFKVTLNLFYKRFDYNERYSGVPDLKDEELINFILTNNIHEVYMLDLSLSDSFGILSDEHYNEQTNELTFILTIDKDYSLVTIDDNINKMIEQIKANLLNYSEIDSLHEYYHTTYTIHDAKKYFKENISFEPICYLLEKDIIIGVIDYRTEQTILVEYIE